MNNNDQNPNIPKRKKRKTSRTLKPTSIYLGQSDYPIMRRYRALAKQLGVSRNKLLVAALRTCIDQFEEELPTSDRIVVHGKEVILHAVFMDDCGVPTDWPVSDHRRSLAKKRQEHEDKGE